MFSIVFEGISGSGKSEQIKRLTEWFKQKDMPVYVFREPGTTQAGEDIRPIARQEKYKIEPFTQFLLFCAARNQLVIEKIRPLLISNERGVILIDRFWKSTYVYQCLLGSVPEDLFWRVRKQVPFVPDLEITLRGNPKIYLPRAKKTSGFEELEFQTKAEEMYEKRFGDGVHIAECSIVLGSVQKTMSWHRFAMKANHCLPGTIEEVFDEVLAIVRLAMPVD